MKDLLEFIQNNKPIYKSILDESSFNLLFYDNLVNCQIYKTAYVTKLLHLQMLINIQKHYVKNYLNVYLH